MQIERLKNDKIGGRRHCYQHGNGNINCFCIIQFFESLKYNTSFFCILLDRAWPLPT